LRLALRPLIPTLDPKPRPCHASWWRPASLACRARLRCIEGRPCFSQTRAQIDEQTNRTTNRQTEEEIDTT